jgi:hypothetical protein
MSHWQELLLFFAGVAAGYINVMAGGGSLLTVPFMVFLGLPGPVANGTNRIAILAQSVTAIWVFFRKGLTELKLSLTLSLFTLPGALLGAYLGVQLDGIWFNRLLAAIMLAVMLLMLVKQKTVTAERLSAVKPWRVRLTYLLMIFVGFYGGLIQVGVGFIIMPVLHRVLGLDLLRVNMHKVFIVLPFTLVSLAVFASEVDLEFRAGVILALGMAAGGWLSTHLMIRKGEHLIKIVFNLALLGMVIKLLFFTG